jgi:hypothetical protein
MEIRKSSRWRVSDNPPGTLLGQLCTAFVGKTCVRWGAEGGGRVVGAQLQPGSQRGMVVVGASSAKSVLRRADGGTFFRHRSVRFRVMTTVRIAHVEPRAVG